MPRHNTRVRNPKQHQVARHFDAHERQRAHLEPMITSHFIIVLYKHGFLHDFAPARAIQSAKARQERLRYVVKRI